MTHPWPDTLPAILAQRARLDPAGVAQRCRDTGGAWEEHSWAELHKDVRRLSAWMCSMGVHPGDAVAILLPNCREWDVVHMAVIAARAIAVGLDVHDTPEKLRTVLEDCAPVAFVGESPEQLEDLIKLRGIGLKFTLTRLPGERSTESPPAGCFLLKAALDSTDDHSPSAVSDADDIATMIYTSGTTGDPKGLQYTNGQVVTAIEAILEALPDVDDKTRIACWLPLSNMFQRIMNLSAIRCGAETWYVDDPRNVMRDVKDIRPHLFVGVPRVYEKLHAGIEKQLRAAPAPLAALMRVLLRVGARYRGLERAGEDPGWLLGAGQALADRLLFRRVRAVLGGEVRYLISGSAPMPVWLLENLHALGWLTLEAYGLSENVVPNAMNRVDCYRFGTVGKPLSPCELRLGDDGEVLVRSPGTIKHYLGDGRDLLDPDGFLATGDFGTLDDQGFLRLSGRKSDLFKTSTGRRVAPASVEPRLSKHPLVDQAVLLGADRPFPVVLLIVVLGEDDQFIGAVKQISRDLGAYSVEAPDYARPVAAIVTTRQLSPEKGEITANMKVRRHALAATWSDVLDDLYRWCASDSPDPVRAASGDDAEVMLCRIQSPT